MAGSRSSARGESSAGRARRSRTGPYAEAKDLIGGYSIVEARDIDQAVELSRGCPGLDVGGLVEVRPVMSMDL